MGAVKWYTLGMNENPQSSENSELSRAQEIVNRFPDGILVYSTKDSSPERSERVQNILETSLPRRLVLVIPDFYGYPADMGFQVGEQLLCYSTTIQELRQSILDHTDLSLEELHDYMPELVRSGRSGVEGGRLIEVAGTNVVISDIASVNLHLARAGIKVIDAPKFSQGLVRLSTDPQFPESERKLLFDHIDLWATALFENGQFYIYMDKLILEHLKRINMLDENLSNAIPVDHESTLKGGLNIKYLDDVVLVTTVSSLNHDLLERLQRMNLRIIELGEDEFNKDQRAGVKCRSLAITWRSK